MKDRLDKAIEEFENENSEISFSIRLSNLRSAWMWNVFETMKDIKKHGKNSQISEEKIYIQEQGIKQFALIEKMYNSELKAAKLEGKKLGDIDKEWLQKIKEGESTIGSIVRDMRDKPDKENIA